MRQLLKPRLLFEEIVDSYIASGFWECAQQVHLGKMGVLFAHFPEIVVGAEYGSGMSELPQQDEAGEGQCVV